MSKRPAPPEAAYFTPIKRACTSISTPGLYNPSFVYTPGKIAKPVSAFDAFPAHEFNDWIDGIKAKASRALAETKALENAFRAEQQRAEQREAQRQAEQEKIAATFKQLIDEENIEADELAEALDIVRARRLKQQQALEGDQLRSDSDDNASTPADESSEEELFSEEEEAVEDDQQDSVPSSERSIVVDDEEDQESDLFSEQSDAALNLEDVHNDSVDLLDANDAYHTGGDDVVELAYDEEEEEQSAESEDEKTSTPPSHEYNDLHNYADIQYDKAFALHSDALTEEEMEDERYRIWQNAIEPEMAEGDEKHHPGPHTLQEYTQEPQDVLHDEMPTQNLYTSTTHNFEVIDTEARVPVSIQEKQLFDDPLEYDAPLAMEEQYLLHLNEETQAQQEENSSEASQDDFPDQFNLVQESDGNPSDASSEDHDDVDDFIHDGSESDGVYDGEDPPVIEDLVDETLDNIDPNLEDS